MASRAARPASLALLTLVALFVARGEAGGPGGAAADRLTVFAAASLTEAFQELGWIFEEEHPGTRVRFNFANSQQLATQLQQGAPADVFASADARWMDYLSEHGLVREPRWFAQNLLVVVTPRNASRQVRHLTDLARPGVKVVLGAAAAPVGRYSRQALAKLAHAPGFPPDFAKRVLANVVSEEETVKLVLAKVRLGEADAGIVYRSDVVGPAAGAVEVLPIPEAYKVVARYPVAVTAAATRPEAATAFLELLLPRRGQAVLERHGFLPEEGDNDRGTAGEGRGRGA